MQYFILDQFDHYFIDLSLNNKQKLKYATETRSIWVKNIEQAQKLTTKIVTNLEN